MGDRNEDVTAKVKQLVDALYVLRDTYFPADKDEKISMLRSQADSALQMLDSIPSEQRESPSQRANYEFLKGKILDVFPVYDKEAEDRLSKAVKLNPSSPDAWLSLGNCLMKKGDLHSAKNCYNLGLKKGPNKKILCDLSMVERMMAQEAENREQFLSDSISHAKDAVGLDVADGYSWYNLGNAYLTSFFLTGSWDYEKLPQSLKAYQNADKDERMKIHPDLYYNYATVNKYLENYERALTGFEAAATRDPSLNAFEEVKAITNALDLIESLLKGLAMDKRLPALASGLDKVNLDSSLWKTTIDNLSEGLNEKVAVVGKVLFFANQEKAVPLYCILCDSEKNCFVVSLFGIRAGAIKVGDRLTLLEPNLRVIDFSWKSKIYQFKSIRLDFLNQFLVNEKPPSADFALCTSFYAQHRP